MFEMDKITNEKQYRDALKRADELVKKADLIGGMDKLAEEEADEFEQIGFLCEAYEEVSYHFPQPNTLKEMIELKMFEQKLKQKDLALLLEVEATRVSEVLNGKRKINMDFAKRLHQKLHIDADFILMKA
jgi:HTH-type transcriptional regulator / antitoxin HigA